jgi:hypothetical protein
MHEEGVNGEATMWQRVMLTGQDPTVKAAGGLGGKLHYILSQEVNI